MLKLLNANLTRLKKSKITFIMSLTVIVMAFIVLFNQYQEFKNYDTLITFDTSLFNIFLIIISLIIAIFTGLFLGIEYSDGTIRNKIIIGHKRKNIYLANLITIIGVSLFFELIFIILISIIGIPLFGFHLASFKYFLYTIFMTQIIIISSACIYTFIATIFSNNTIINVVCLLIAFGSYFTTLALMQIVETPEYIETATITDNDSGGINYIKEKNPKYPSELTRKICNTIMDIIPQSQSIKIISNKVTNQVSLPIYSICTIILFTTTGIIIFNKKELN